MKGKKEMTQIQIAKNPPNMKKKMNSTPFKIKLIV